MSRTPALRKFEAQLARVNDLLCYYLFSDAEVEGSLSGIVNADPDTYTTDAFPENRFSERLHIRTSKLPSFRELAFHTSVGVSLIGAVEYLLSYIAEVEEFRASVVPTEHDQIKHERPEEQLRQKLQSWVGHDPLDSALTMTIKYLRLRRNHIAHVRDEMSQDFKDLTKNHAAHLNRFWQAQPTEIYDFDFSNADYSSFNPDEALALVNLTRVCMKQIDEAILASISATDIAKFEIINFLSRPGIRGISEARQANKFRAYLRHRYGREIGCSTDEFRSIAGYA